MTELIEKSFFLKKKSANLTKGMRVGCFAWFVFLVSHDCCMALPRVAMGLSAVYDCGIS